MKTARFTNVVMKCGTPQIHLAWTAPDRDPMLQRARKQNRLLTVHRRTRGAKKDYAVVGLQAEPDVQYLIFPRSLRAFQERHIVGIQYDLLEDAPVSIGPAPARRRPRPKPVKPAGAPTGPKLVPFNSDGDESGRARPTPAPAEALSPREIHLRAEMRRVLKELRAGHTARGARRLQALLDPPQKTAS